MSAQLQALAAQIKALQAQYEQQKAAEAAAHDVITHVPAPAPAPVRAPRLEMGQPYYGKHPISTFGKLHRTLAAEHAHLRDHQSWSKFWNPGANGGKGAFMSKEARVPGSRERVYHTLLAQRKIAVPSGQLFDSRSGRMVYTERVSGKKGLFPKYAKRRIVDSVIYGEDMPVTMTGRLFYPMGIRDDHGKLQGGHAKEKQKRVRATSRFDGYLKQVEDPDGFFHQSALEFTFTTSEAAAKEWKEGISYWIEGGKPEWSGYVGLTALRASGIYKGAVSNNGRTFGDVCEAFAGYTDKGSLTAIVFDSIIADTPSSKYDALTVPNKMKGGSAVYSKYGTLTTVPGATCLEGWLMNYSGKTERLQYEGCCGYDVVIESFAACFDRLQSDKSHPRFRDVELTVPWLYENVFHPGEAFDAQRLALTLPELGLFFKRFRVSLFVLDITQRVIYSEVFKEKSKGGPGPWLDEKIRPNSVYVMQHGAHLFRLTDLKELQQKAHNERAVIHAPLKPFEDLGEEQDKAPTEHYSLGGNEAPVQFIDSINDLPTITTKVVKSVDKKNVETYWDRIRVAVPANLWVLLEQLIECKYMPRICLGPSNAMQSITLRLDGVDVNVSAPHVCSPDPYKDSMELPDIPDKAVFDAYCRHEKALKDCLRNKKTMSTYSDSFLDILRQLNRTPLQYGTIFSGLSTAYDINCSYTSFLQRITMVPVFNEFDEFEPYVSVEHSVRDRLSFYLVLNTLRDTSDPRHLLLDQQYCLLTYDTWLICREWSCTLAVIRPSVVVPVNPAAAIHNLWEDGALDRNLKKFLVNSEIGKCGKRYNTKSHALLFQDASEARHYQDSIGGERFLRRLGEHSYHIVTRSRQTALCDGFYPLQHMIYDMQRLALYKKALEVGKPVLAVKTDCLWFMGHDAEVPKDRSYSGIGGWEVAHDAPRMPDGLRDKLVFDEIRIDYAPQIVELPVANEYDVGASVDYSTVSRLLTLGDTPGAGKTYSYLQYAATLGDAVLFVAPLNTLCDDLMSCKCSGVACDRANPVCLRARKAITINKLLGIIHHADGEGQKACYDMTGITTVVFDEVFFFTPPQLGKLKRWMDAHPDLCFLAAGDPHQNAPIYSLCMSTAERKAYYMRIVSTLFPTRIVLRVCKRVKSEAERAIVEDLRHRINDTDEPLLDIVRRHFKPIRRLEDMQGMAVTYKRDTAKLVNTFCNARAVDCMAEVTRNAGRCYHVGQMLRTCEWDDKLKLPMNILFRITEIGSVVKLRSDARDCSIEVKFGVLNRCFTYTHAHTGHSLQGTSVASGITIFDLGHPFMSRAWLYTALTRSRSMDQVYYMDPSVKLSGLAEVKDADLRSRIERKIDGHRKADSDKERRYHPSEYVDTETVLRLLREQGGCCSHCNEEVLLQWKEAAGTRDTRQFSIDRINNNVAHTKNNVVVSCLRCNNAHA